MLLHIGCMMLHVLCTLHACGKHSVCNVVCMMYAYCMHVVYMLYACCMHVVCLLLYIVCFMHVFLCMLDGCGKHSVGMLYASFIYV